LLDIQHRSDTRSTIVTNPPSLLLLLEIRRSDLTRPSPRDPSSWAWRPTWSPLRGPGLRSRGRSWFRCLVRLRPNRPTSPPPARSSRSCSHLFNTRLNAW